MRDDTNTAANGEADGSPDVESAIRVLLRLAGAARVYRSGDGGLHARVPIGDRHEVYGLKSGGFRDWLIDGYFGERQEPPSTAAIMRVVSLLEARTRFDGGTPPVFIRVGGAGDQSGSSYFLDLGDSSGAAIKICASGWQVVLRPEIYFKRPAGQLRLPVPCRGGSIELLRRYVNVRDDGFRLLIGWLTAALRPVGPYPILSLHGEQGSAKSTLARILRLLIDPQASSLLAEPANNRDLMATAVNGWLLAYDNITAIPDWFSNSLCRLAYGGGISGRALFTNDERSVVDAQRPVILNGIDDYMRKSDLIDRTVFLHLASIHQNARRAEQEFWSSFRAEHAQILGGVLDAVVGGIRALPSVALTRLPRMADFAIWGEAVGRGLGWEPESFMRAYEESRREATEASLESSPLGDLLLRLAPTILNWECSPTEMFQILTEKVGKKVATSAAWPKSTQQFTTELRRLAPQLRMHGLSIISSRTRLTRLIRVVTAAFLASAAEINGGSDDEAAA
jgi:hypothetical protein